MATEKVEKNCQNCNFQTSGVGAITSVGTVWGWQDCSKGWGKPPFIGVTKNLCGIWKPKALADESVKTT